MVEIEESKVFLDHIKLEDGITVTLAINRVFNYIPSPDF
jgi:hypothetical protein